MYWSTKNGLKLRIVLIIFFVRYLNMKINGIQNHCRKSRVLLQDFKKEPKPIKKRHKNIKKDFSKIKTIDESLISNKISKPDFLIFMGPINPYNRAVKYAILLNMIEKRVGEDDEKVMYRSGKGGIHEKCASIYNQFKEDGSSDFSPKVFTYWYAKHKSLEKDEVNKNIGLLSEEEKIKINEAFSAEVTPDYLDKWSRMYALRLICNKILAGLENQKELNLGKRGGLGGGQTPGYIKIIGLFLNTPIVRRNLWEEAQMDAEGKFLHVKHYFTRVSDDPKQNCLLQGLSYDDKRSKDKKSNAF